MLNVIQDKWSFIFIEFVGYNQRHLPKDLEELFEVKPNKFCLWWAGEQQRLFKVGVFNVIPLVAVSIGSTQAWFFVLNMARDSPYVKQAQLSRQDKLRG